MSRTRLTDLSQDETLDQDALARVRGGGGRRVELDHMGAYNFMVEISGVNAGLLLPYIEQDNL